MPRRRGSVYILVLAAGVSLTALGVGGLILAQSQRRATDLREHAALARGVAQSGLEGAVAAVNADPNGVSWRTNRTFTAVSDAGFSRASCLAVVSDPADADLRDDPEEGVRITSGGTLGAASQTLRIDLAPELASLPVMSYALWAGTAVAFSSSTLYADATIGSNGSVTAWKAAVNAPVEGATVSGAAFNKGTQVVARGFTLPGTACVAAWAAVATPIPFASLSAGNIDKVVLSASYNPYGPANARAVYSVDCRGSNITIKDSRINATLVLLNAGSGSKVDRGAFFEPPAGQPALIVDGSFEFQTDSGDLSESSINANLNPSGAPFLGDADADKTDSYPSAVQGWMLVTGDLSIAGGKLLTVEGGAIVRGTFTNKGTLVVRSRTPSSPMLGFREIKRFVRDPATLTREVK